MDARGGERERADDYKKFVNICSNIWRCIEDVKSARRIGSHMTVGAWTRSGSIEWSPNLKMSTLVEICKFLLLLATCLQILSFVQLCQGVRQFAPGLVRNSALNGTRAAPANADHQHVLRNEVFSRINRRQLGNCADLNPLLAMKVDAVGGMLDDVQIVTVTVTGALDPSDLDWIAVMTDSSSDRYVTFLQHSCSSATKSFFLTAAACYRHSCKTLTSRILYSAIHVCFL